MKALIYDNECPLCAAYSAAFVRLGLLRSEERIPFAALDQQEFIARLDASRQGNEIPLVDLAGGETLYGLDVLLHLVGRRWPFLSRAASVRPLYWLLKKVYALISYNRRIILARNFCSNRHNCAPSYNFRYRLAFIVFAALFSVFITFLFGQSFSKTTPAAAFLPGLRMLVVCSPGWILTLAAAVLFLQKDRLEYAGHLATLQITGVLVLVPAIIVSPFLSPLAGMLFCLVCVVCSSALMLRGHYRRIKLLGLSQAWTIAWMTFMQGSAAAAVIFFFHH